jgi:hypothetical protein
MTDARSMISSGQVRALAAMEDDAQFGEVIALLEGSG